MKCMDFGMPVIKICAFKKCMCFSEQINRTDFSITILKFLTIFYMGFSIPYQALYKPNDQLIMIYTNHEKP